MAGPTLSLTGRALRLLSAREHSRAELEPGALARVLDSLQAKDFINEDRVLESVLHRRAGKLGLGRIRQELQAKGLQPEAVAEAVDQLRGSEVERARAVWRKKFGAAPQDAAQRARQMRFLAARGFAGDTIRKVVGGSDDD